MELTGSITTTEEGPAPPAGICAPFSDTYEAAVDSGDTWVGLSATGESVLDGGSSNDRLRAVLESLYEAGLNIITFPDWEEPLPTDVPLDKAPGAVFVFSFAFDNGYHSNQSLEGLGDPYLEITQRATITAYGGASLSRRTVCEAGRLPRLPAHCRVKASS